MPLHILPPRLNFWEVPTGPSPTGTFLIFNHGDAPIELGDPVTRAPFSAILSSRRVEPRSFASASVSVEAVCVPSALERGFQTWKQVEFSSP